MTPLNERVVAPEVVELPSGPDGAVWRAASPADIDAIAELEREIAAVDHPHYVISREEIADDFARTFFDASADSLVATGTDGSLLAWGIAVLPPGQDTLVRSILSGGVRPSARGRGIGRRLLAWQQGRGMQQLASSDKPLPGWLMVYAAESDSARPAVRLYERAGLSLARYFLELRRDLSQPVEDVPLDPAVRIQRFTPELSSATHAAKNDAFRDHWGSQPSTDEQWDAMVAREIARPDLSFVAVAGDEVAGLVIVTTNEEDWPGQGFSSAYIDLVGVRRAWRKRGIAPALLAETVRAAAAAGLDKAVLDVDAENPTGALGLYTGLGFAESNRTLAYTKTF